MGAALPPRTVGKTIRLLARRFDKAGLVVGHGTHNAREEASWLVLHVLGVPLDALEEHAGRTLTKVQSARIERLAARRVRERIPAAYLIHEAWLGEFRFHVDRRAIVPRSFIAEILADDIAPLVRGPVRKALDLCTGSGCLAILLADALPDCKVDAADLSSAALSVARRNVSDYRLGRRVRLVRSDMFNELAARRYDLIVSNPPYVDVRAMAKLPAEYRSEPRMSLAGGDDGLHFVRRILAHARRHLHRRGTLVCEIGHNRKALERAFPRLGFTWLETSAGNRFVFLLDAEQLPG